MKRFRQLLIIFSAAGFAMASCKDEEAKPFSVTGAIKNREARMIYLEETPVATLQRKVIDSIQVGSGGKFSLKTKAKEESIYNLRLDDDVYPFVSLINDASKITVEADFADTKNLYTVTGSPSSSELKDYLLRSGEMMRTIYDNDRKADSLEKIPVSDSLLSKMETERKSQVDNLKKYTSESISKSKSPSLAMFILSTYQGIANNPGFGISALSNEEVGAIINEVSGKFPEHQGVASIKKFFDQQMSQAGLVGKTAPEIVLPDTEGNEIALSSLRGQYVLVDFWASWCKPCRDENPNVVKAYNKYKGNNFTILGVSLDQKKEPWVKAIVDDRLNWTHISDLKWWSSVVVPLYGIEGIPYNVLVDPSGKIIAENLRGNALHEKLNEVLQ